MARGDLINVIGIEKVIKDLDQQIFSEFKTKRKIVDTSTKNTLKPLLAQAKYGSAVHPKDIAAFTSGVTGYTRKAIPRGTYKKSWFIRKKKNWQGLIIRHGASAVHDAWFWRFLEYGYVHWRDGKKKMPAGQYGRLRSIFAGSQQAMLSKWLRHMKKEMKSRIPKMNTRIT